MLGVGIPLATIDTPEMEYVPQEKRTKIEQKQFPGTDNLKKKPTKLLLVLTRLQLTLSHF